MSPYSLPHSEQHEVPEDVVDLEDPFPSPGAHLPCVAAIEFMADTYEATGGNDLMRATEVKQHSAPPLVVSLGANLVYSFHVKLWKSLAHEHDTMRKKYVILIRRLRVSLRQLN